MSSHAPQLDPVPTPLDLMRDRVDLWNRRFHDLASDLGRIDSTLSKAIGDHLDAIGLDDIRTQSNKDNEK